MKPTFFFNLFFSLISIVSVCQTTTITGTVTSYEGTPLPFANIYEARNTTNVAQSDIDGVYKIDVTGDMAILVYSMTGYIKSVDTIKISGKEILRYNKKMQVETKAIQEVMVTNKREREENLIRINPKIITNMPGVSLGGVETTIKTQPGVISRNEFSTQYNVRGGNFDENLVYVNDIMIFRPILVRSGQQEGLSFINSDMISSITFSSGGFGADFGDRMASVLDIKYKKPTEFGASINASMIGASGHVENISKNKKFTQITGIRYKNTRLALRTIGDTGEYSPSFGDIQTQMTYQLNKNHQLGFLGYFANNNYRFVPPEKKTVKFGGEKTYKIDIYFEGKEEDKYSSLMGAVWDEWQLSPTSKVKFIVSVFKSYENEAYDIISSYRLDDLASQKGETEQLDSTVNTSTGSYFRHARNDLQSTVYDASIIGQLEKGKSFFTYGTSVQSHEVDLVLNEWVYIDSAGYNIPYSDSVINIDGTVYNNIKYTAINASVFAQNTWRFQLGGNFLSFTAGVRGNYKNTSNQYLASPRVKLSFKPDWKRDIIFRVACGYYYQPAFFKEMVDVNGQIHESQEAQEAIHYMAGGELTTIMMNRPVKVTFEGYYKDLRNIIPYSIDNVRLQYFPEKRAKGYAKGIDLKLNGEFIKGTESWISLSFMRTKEDVIGDNEGFVRRPTDQLINLGIFFQDFLPWDNTVKFNMTWYYGSSILSNPPFTEQGRKVTTTLPAYNRLDVGISKQLLSEAKSTSKGWLISSIWAGIEILNAADTYNTASFFWLRDVDGAYYASPNYLAGRILNLKLTAKI